MKKKLRSFEFYVSWILVVALLVKSPVSLVAAAELDTDIDDVYVMEQVDVLGEVVYELEPELAEEIIDEVEDSDSAYECEVDESEDVQDVDLAYEYDVVEAEGAEAYESIMPISEIVATGTVGSGGAPWTLDDQGVVRVGGGTITRVGTATLPRSPWYRRADIRQIIFTEPVVAIDMQSMFAIIPNLNDIIGLELIDTSNVTSMHRTFASSPNLTQLDLSHWDTSNVTDMSHMFSLATGLTNINVSTWDTSNVTTMGSMFWGAQSLIELDVSGWDTSRVRQMNGMFYSATSLVALDVLNWDTSNVILMSSMFHNNGSLVTLDVSGWDTSNVTTMSNMFTWTHSLNYLNVSNWNTENVSNMNNMFWNSAVFELDVSNWDTGNVTTMSFLFQGATHLTHLDVSNWNTSRVTSMNGMFGATVSQRMNLAALDVSNWDTSNVTTMQGMFSSNPYLTYLDLSNWDMSNVRTTLSMFNRMPSLNTLILGPQVRFPNTNTGLPSIRQTDTYTGFWQNIGRGTVESPTGEFVLTSTELIRQFDGETMADTFVWQRHNSVDLPVIHTVAFNLHGGTGSFPAQEIEDGELVTAPTAIPTRTGYTFLGWFTTADGDIEFNFATSITVDTTIHAQWERDAVTPYPVIHNVTFDLHGGAGSFPVQEIEDGKLVTAPTAVPTRTGYRFAGWFTTADGDVEFDFTTPITADTTVHAQWTRNVIVSDPDPGTRPSQNGNNNNNNNNNNQNNNNNNNLPQTGAIVGSSILVGFALATTGTVMASKKKKDK